MEHSIIIVIKAITISVIKDQNVLDFKFIILIEEEKQKFIIIEIFTINIKFVCLITITISC